MQRTLTVKGSITVWLVSSLTRLDSTSSLHTNNNIFSLLVNSSIVKLDPSRMYSDPSQKGEWSL